MSPREINISNVRLGAESIKTIDDVRIWARDHEIRMNNEVDQLQDAIIALEDVDDKQQKGINRNLKLLVTSTIVFGSAFAVIVVLFGIPQIIERLFIGAP